ncbi:MAG: hypothetical protein IJT40_04005 [Firmicutes bacterium]|nr:hypothetical protein [Bacillota bacterium]
MKKLTEDLKIEYLLNSGVLLEMGERKILVDGLPSDLNDFDKLSPELEEEIMARQGDFAGLNDLFFTHCHGDHMSGRKVSEFIRRGDRTFVVVPENAKLDFPALKKEGGRFFYPQGELGEVGRAAMSADLDFQYMRTGHLTFDYPEHYAFNFLRGDTSIMVVGDMDLTKLSLLKKFERREHAFLVADSFLVWRKRWCEQVDKMGFEKVFICHLPSDANDPWNYRKRGLKGWDEHCKDLPNWELWNL